MLKGFKVNSSLARDIERITALNGITQSMFMRFAILETLNKYEDANIKDEMGKYFGKGILL